MAFIDYPAMFFFGKACPYPSCVCAEKALASTQALSFLIKIVRYGGGEGERGRGRVSFRLVCFTAKLAFVPHQSLSLSVTHTQLSLHSTVALNPYESLKA